MSVTDTELELLESYLDDELTGRDLEALRQRLSSEPALSAAMDELRSEREMRQMFFSSCEPDDMSVQRLVRSVKQDVNREIVWSKRSRSLRSWASLAACLFIGLFVGRGMRQTTPAEISSTPQPIIQASNDPSLVRPKLPEIQANPPLRFDGPVVVEQSPTHVQFGLTGSGLETVGSQNPFEGYTITVIDRNGNTVRRFDSPEQYQNFVNEHNQQFVQPTTAPSVPN